jgi:hypothetical protein
MQQREMDALRNELSLKAKNGIDFTTAATIIWAAIAWVWHLDGDPYNKSVLVFIVGAPLLPLAFGLSKVYKTEWKVKDNPLQPLGLWLNFAQLFYFPFLVFVLLRHPDYFVMTYAIITCAHFFPYAWYYNTKLYAIFAGLISVGSLLIALNLPLDKQYYVGVWISACLLVLTLGLVADFRRKRV